MVMLDEASLWLISSRLSLPSSINRGEATSKPLGWPCNFQHLAVEVFIESGSPCSHSVLFSIHCFFLTADCRSDTTRIGQESASSFFKNVFWLINHFSHDLQP